MVEQPLQILHVVVVDAVVSVGVVVDAERGECLFADVVLEFASHLFPFPRVAFLVGFLLHLVEEP